MKPGGTHYFRVAQCCTGLCCSSVLLGVSWLAWSGGIITASNCLSYCHRHHQRQQWSLHTAGAHSRGHTDTHTHAHIHSQQGTGFLQEVAAAEWAIWSSRGSRREALSCWKLAQWGCTCLGEREAVSQPPSPDWARWRWAFSVCVCVCVCVFARRKRGSPNPLFQEADQIPIPNNTSRVSHRPSIPFL